MLDKYLKYHVEMFLHYIIFNYNVLNVRNIDNKKEQRKMF